MGIDAGACTERELTTDVDLCGPDGALNPAAVGWSRRPLHRCALPRSWGRRKRWDFWGITGPGCAMNIVVADVDYVGITGMWFCDFATGRTIDTGSASPLGRAMHLPEVVGGATIASHARALSLEIAEVPGGTRIRATASGFEADVLVHRPDRHESLGVVIPWGERRFQYTNKDVARPAEGWARWKGETFEFSWGCLDFGRGKWPYRTTWNWGAGAGMCDGVRVGVQLGGKWTDGTGMTENALSIDGKLSKISEELVWTYDTSDWLKPWTIRTPRSDRVDLTFTPIYDKPTRLQLGVASQRVDQCFGTYSGRIVPDSGDVTRVDGLFGWAEEAAWRW
jgi:hypothetical protein